MGTQGIKRGIRGDWGFKQEGENGTLIQRNWEVNLWCFFQRGKKGDLIACRGFPRIGIPFSN